MKKLLFTWMALALFLSGCKKDNEGGAGGNTTVPTTVAEDKQNIEIALNEIVTCLGTMKNGAMMNSVVAFTGLSDGEVLKEEFIEAIMSRMQEGLDTIDVPTGDRFYFSKYTGTWAYQSSDSSWSRAASPANEIIILLPSDDAQTSNNLEIKLAGYIDHKYTFDQEDIWLPKSFSFSVKKDGSKIAGIDLTNLSLEQSQDVLIPTDLSGSVFLNPFTFSVSGERVTSTEFSAEIGLNDGAGCEYSFSSKLKLKHDDYENLTSEDFTSIEGDLGHNSIKINYFIDYGKMALIGEQNGELTEQNINDNIDVDILINNVNIGNVVVKSVTDNNSDEEVEFHIVYKDGTSENTSVYYEPFFDDVEALFSDLIGPWDLDEVQ